MSSAVRSQVKLAARARPAARSRSRSAGSESSALDRRGDRAARPPGRRAARRRRPPPPGWPGPRWPRAPRAPSPRAPAARSPRTATGTRSSRPARRGPRARRLAPSRGSARRPPRRAAAPARAARPRAASGSRGARAAAGARPGCAPARRSAAEVLVRPLGGHAQHDRPVAAASSRSRARGGVARRAGRLPIPSGTTSTRSRDALVKRTRSSRVAAASHDHPLRAPRRERHEHAHPERRAGRSAPRAARGSCRSWTVSTRAKRPAAGPWTPRLCTSSTPGAAREPREREAGRPRTHCTRRRGSTGATTVRASSPPRPAGERG